MLPIANLSASVGGLEQGLPAESNGLADTPIVGPQALEQTGLFGFLASLQSELQDVAGDLGELPTDSLTSALGPQLPGSTPTEWLLPPGKFLPVTPTLQQVPLVPQDGAKATQSLSLATSKPVTTASTQNLVPAALEIQTDLPVADEPPVLASALPSLSSKLPGAEKPELSALGSRLDSVVNQTSMLSTSSQPANGSLSGAYVLDSANGVKDFADAFANRVVWLAREGQHSATLRINPPHLGSVEVRIVMNDNEASVSFSVQQDATKELIEQSVNRLREMFGGAGIALQDANVRSQNQGQSDADSGNHEDQSTADARAASDSDNHASQSIGRKPTQGLIDHYV